MATETQGGEEAATGLPQLDFSTFPNQIFWLVVTLVVIYLILTKVGLPRIAGVLAERQGTITNDIAMAEDLKAGRPVPGGLGVEGATLRHRAWLSANERRLQMRARWREFFQDWDVVLAPIAPTVAIPHDHSHPMSARTIDVAGETRPYGSLMQWMGLFGLVYLPATAVPIGLQSSGLPMALQVVGPFLEDHTALAAAAMVESITGGFRRPPGW